MVKDKIKLLQILLKWCIIKIIMKEQINFENALKELEGIVKKLEAGGLSLEESLTAFEKGMKLSKICFKKLNEAQHKIEILTKDEQTGELTTKPFSLEEEIVYEEDKEEEEELPF